jgi:alanine racemase
MTVPYNFFDQTPRDCWVDINAAQLAENVRHLQAFIGKPVLVAVKANGYGHGYEIAARAFLKGGAKYLGVANYGEGKLLRELGVTAPILALSALNISEMKLCADADIDFFVWRPDHIDALRQMPKSSKPIRAHIKVDTGMGRVGCHAEEVGALGAALKTIPDVAIAGLATHFAIASIPNNDHTNGQIDQFNHAIDALEEQGIRPEIIHAANSSAALYHPRARFDMVRIGVVAYGVPPSAVVGPVLPPGVKTALEWRARITSSKIMPQGSTISYGCEYVMPKEARVGIIPVGYADGFHRIPKNVNAVLVEGQERAVLGRINNDQCMIDLDGFPDLTGAEVVLLGKQGDKEISVQELARRWETNTYSVYAGIMPRVPRHVVA